ncbi:MAG: dihydropteroate synthase [Ruminococcaceae bacterium]|nr:dihydropteroate synthase [Oscillospiraceae bacterium]
MLIISEKLNSSIPSVLEFFQKKDDDALIELIKKQESAGATYIDINTAVLQDGELDAMLYAIDLVKKNSKLGIMIDTPNVSVVHKAVEAAEGSNIIINSVTVSERIDELMDLFKSHPDMMVVGLPIPKAGIPHTAEERVRYAGEIIEKFAANGIGEERIFIDVLVEALAVGDNNAALCLETLRLLKETYPNVKTTGGFSNISFGLPKRMVLNTAFLAMAMYQGLDSAIMDPAPDAMRKSYRAINALLGKDEYCMDYIDEIRGTEE